MLDQKITSKFEVTLEALRKKGACYSGYNKVVRALQGKPFTAQDNVRNSYLAYTHDEPISLLSILESNGLNDALWALQCVPESEKDVRLFAVACARKVQHLMTNNLSIAALDVAEKFAYGAATVEELATARVGAVSVWMSTYTNHGGAGTWDILASTAACDAAQNVTWVGDMDNSQAISWAAATLTTARNALTWAMAASVNVAWTADMDTAQDAGWKTDLDAARAAALTDQVQLFISMCSGIATWQTKQ